jgi:hypothetical protein
MKIDAVRLDRYVAIGKKYLDALWDAIAAKREPWDDGRIRLWLAPRLGRPPWLCWEIWAKYAADRKAAEKPKVAPEPSDKGKDPEPERKSRHEAPTHAHKGSRK